MGILFSHFSRLWKPVQNGGFLLVCLFSFIVQSPVFSQSLKIQGKVVDAQSRKPIESASISIPGLDVGGTTDSSGNFILSGLPDTLRHVWISAIGYERKWISFTYPPKQIFVAIFPKAYTTKGEAVVEDHMSRHANVERIDPKVGEVLANPTGNFELILQSFGARSNNELSSQYSVRGGNFDENLVYVNDFEIYRPLLARSGQQEGMSFIHTDMVGSIRFSAGSFEAKYGDKLSSVLDVRYRRPEYLKTHLNLSLMGAMVSNEGVSKNGKFSWLAGMRYRTLRNLLNTLDTQGEYRPVFGDVQSLFTYRPSLKHEWQLLLSYAENQYEVVPTDRETLFGTVKNAVLFRVYFDGRELTDFKTMMGGLSYSYTPHPRLSLKWLASAYQSLERERADVTGGYYLDQVDADLGSPTFGKVLFSKGTGEFQNFGRNRLVATIANTEGKFSYQSPSYGLWQGGVKLQGEQVQDRFFEWNRIDSAGFSVPRQGDSVVYLNEYRNTQNNVNSLRMQAYLQHTWILNDRLDMVFTSGIRAHYWSFNGQTTFSPRFQFSFKPRPSVPLVLRAAIGHYAQPAFYREMRDLQGVVNPSIRAQQSVQYLAGMDYNFKAWGRSFRFVTEAYYKDLYSLIPYVVDNVRLRYFATNNSSGYAQGIDFRLNGEFVNSMESWVSLSFLQTGEDLQNDSYVDKNGEVKQAGFIPRPTDQRFNLSVMFQDYFPTDPTYKVSLTMVYGTGLPFGPPGYQKYQDTLRMPDYRRVDIGFSKQLIGKGSTWKAGGMNRYINSAWLSLEVFNLLQVNNTVSYLWVRDAQQQQYAVPNYLSARQLNLRLVIDLK